MKKKVFFSSNKIKKIQKKRIGPVTIQKKRFHTEKELIHYVKNIVSSSSNGKPLDSASSNFIQGRNYKIY